MAAIRHRRMSGAGVGQASTPIRGMKRHASQRTTRPRTGNPMHRHATTATTPDYESAALPLSYWPFHEGNRNTMTHGIRCRGSEVGHVVGHTRSRPLARRAAETSRRMESATDPIVQVGRGAV